MNAKRTTLLLVLSWAAAGCAASARSAATSDTRAYRAALAPGPRGAMTPEEAWYHDHYHRAPALDVRFGKATYYGESLAGNLTASGETFDPFHFTAAHRELPFGTVVRVVRLDTGHHTYVKINDRGPFGNEQRVIDLAKVAATRLEMIRAGVVEVRIEVLSWGDGKYQRTASR